MSENDEKEIKEFLEDCIMHGSSYESAMGSKIYNLLFNKDLNIKNNYKL